MVGIKALKPGLYLVNNQTPVEVFKDGGDFYAYFPDGHVEQVWGGEDENRPRNSLSSRYLAAADLGEVLTKTGEALEVAKRNYNFVQLLYRKREKT